MLAWMLSNEKTHKQVQSRSKADLPDVASSSSNTWGFRINARAIAILCLNGLTTMNQARIISQTMTKKESDVFCFQPHLLLTSTQLNPAFTNFCFILHWHLLNELVRICELGNSYYLFIRRLQVGSFQTVHNVTLNGTGK